MIGSEIFSTGAGGFADALSLKKSRAVELHCRFDIW